MSEFAVPSADLLAVAPEVVTGAGALVLLVVGARRGGRVWIPAASVALLAASGVAAVLVSGRGTAFGGAVIADGFSAFARVLLAAVASLSLVASIPYLRSEDSPATEYGGLVLLATTGMMLMAAAGDLILIFVALETFSLALYVMAALRRRRLDSQEASLKYFLTGSFASAFLLYGVALIYGGTGTTRLLELAGRAPGGNRGLLLAGLALVLVGLAFKVAAVPFHFWTPDAYQGAPAPVAGFIAAGSKVAAFAALVRVLSAALGPEVPAWRPAVAVLAVATMAAGSLVAVAQSNVKRMLAYSAIAHSGFLLAGVAAGNERAVSGTLFYLAAYAAVIVAAFAVVYAVGRPGEERVLLEDYRGLAARRPFLAGIFALLLASLAGIPPTAGFWAKVEVFSAAAEAGLGWLVVVGVLSSAVAAFFYLRVVVLMFLEESPEWVSRPDPTGPAAGVVTLAGAVVVALLGVVPQPLLDLARRATITIP